MMDATKQRWIENVLAEIARGMPVLPWERHAKRQRRLAALTRETDADSIAQIAE